MKTKHFTLLAIVTVLTFLLTSCGIFRQTTQNKTTYASKLEKPKTNKEELCNPMKYLDTDEFFRFRATGEGYSEDQATTQAYTNAQIGISQKPQISFYNISRNFTSENTHKTEQDINKVMKKLNAAIGKIQIKEITTVCMALEELKNGKFRRVMVLQTPRTQFRAAVKNVLNEYKLKADFEERKFINEVEKDFNTYEKAYNKAQQDSVK